jgi:hypothetical protein
MKNYTNILVVKPERNRTLGIPKRGKKDNIRTDLREIRWEGVDWMHLAQDRDQGWGLVNKVMNFRVPQKAGNFLTSRVTI